MNVLDFAQHKARQQKIVMVTCYDASAAAMVAASSIQVVLVGDSVAMTVHGYDTTVHATLEMMTMHVAAVARGAPSLFIVGDLPFLSHRIALEDTMRAVRALVQAGACAVKLEGASGNLDTIRHIVDSGVPVMGHIGLTPQFYHGLGGFRVQGKTDVVAERLVAEAMALEQAGCFAVVVECVPSSVAARITAAVNVPTIGIGAGPTTDGQILVWHDLLGLQAAASAKFVKQFVSGFEQMRSALDAYSAAVQAGDYPVAGVHDYA